jgi:hypothetical protein
MFLGGRKRHDQLAGRAVLHLRPIGQLHECALERHIQHLGIKRAMTGGELRGGVEPDANEMATLVNHGRLLEFFGGWGVHGMLAHGRSASSPNTHCNAR